MPRKVKTSEQDDRRKAVQGKGSFQGYINHNLTAEEKAKYDLWTPDAEELFDAIERLVDSGYKLSTSHDDYNDTRQASLTCNNKQSEDYGWVLVARAPDSYNAIALVVFKHVYLLEGDWTAFHSRQKEKSSWG